jgi:hypothetical protein
MARLRYLDNQFALPVLVSCSGQSPPPAYFLHVLFISIAFPPAGMTCAGPDLLPVGPPPPPAPRCGAQMLTNTEKPNKNIRAEIFIWALGRKHRPMPIYLVAPHTTHPPSLLNLVLSMFIVILLLILICLCLSFSRIPYCTYDRTVFSITECLVK